MFLKRRSLNPYEFLIPLGYIVCALSRLYVTGFMGNAVNVTNISFILNHREQFCCFEAFFTMEYVSCGKHEVYFRKWCIQNSF